MIDGMTFPMAIRDVMMNETRELDQRVTLMGEDEFRQFYERTARSLWSYLSRITGNRQQADDLLQEAFYRFYRAGKRHDSEAHRRNSLFQIATNLVRDAARHTSRYQDVSLEEHESALESHAHSSGPEHDATVRTDLGRAMKQLEPSQRELLWLAYAQGASHEEIAEVLGVRAISVRTLLFRARKRLAAILGERASS